VVSEAMNLSGLGIRRAGPFHHRHGKIVIVVDEIICPDCGGKLTSAVGYRWRDENDLLQWVGTCVTCNRRTGGETSFGVVAGSPVRVNPFRVEADDGLIP
jgi:hypothetical protein